MNFIPVNLKAPYAIKVSFLGQALIWYRTNHSSGQNSTQHLHWRDNAPQFEVATNVLPAQDLKAPVLAVEKHTILHFPSVSLLVRKLVGLDNERIIKMNDEQLDLKSFSESLEF
jgi:hypothetical protein